RLPEVAEPHQIRVGRLPDEHPANLRVVVQRIAAAETELDSGSVHISVRIRQDRRGLSLIDTDRAGIDVAIDTRIETSSYIDSPAPGPARTLRRCRRHSGQRAQTECARDNKTADTHGMTLPFV